LRPLSSCTYRVASRRNNFFVCGIDVGESRAIFLDSKFDHPWCLLSFVVSLFRSLL
jgi:hypothetical protein